MTRQRQIIYDAVTQTPCHMTAEEIYDLVRARMPGIARATVYRNLGLMERDGQVGRVRIAGAPDRYDRTVSPHEHIRCPRCGALEDVALPWLSERLTRELGRPVQRVFLQAEALCADCAGKEQM